VSSEAKALWEATSVQNLVRYRPAGTYFARFRVQVKEREIAAVQVGGDGRVLPPLGFEHGRVLEPARAGFED
jgi:hypothetical protein